MRSQCSPIEDVSPWMQHSGAVLLDTSLSAPEGQSLFACAPTRTVRGNIFQDTLELEELLAAGSLQNPSGGLVGAVDYFGNFCFGAYDRLHRYSAIMGDWDVPLPALVCEEDSPTDDFFLQWNALPDSSKFAGKVRQIQAFIAAGDIYQACLTIQLTGRFSGNPWALYKKLRELSPAPYSAFLQLGETTLLSASPELFLQMKGRQIVTRPIKGTRPRKTSSSSECDVERELLSSEKERAELLMITDLERNDLGRVCEFGSVSVPELLRLERFAQVYHLVSTVQGTMRSDISHPQALAACFPGGSITGAPKRRAMEILREMESTPRKYYTGAIGYFAFDGSSCFNIAIRTLELSGSSATYGTGAGIVADSVPHKEWEETMTKASAILSLGS